jgi:uncharacterized protein with GYD domain
MAREYIGAPLPVRLQPAAIFRARRVQRAAPAGVQLPATSVTRAKENTMPKYLIEAAYTAEGLRGLQKDKASGRRQALAKAVESLEGKLEAFYFSMGDRDVVSIVEAPDAVSMAALSLAASATGLVRVNTTALLSVEEVDRALEKKHSYRGPGA